MTWSQQRRLAELIRELRPGEVHHGDCIGSDAQFHRTAMRCGFILRVVVHPPIEKEKRAFCRGKGAGRVLVKFAKPYMVRNQDIVDACTVLIAAPPGYREVVRSGTWATVRRGRKAGRRVIVVWPDGTTKEG